MDKPSLKRNIDAGTAPRSTQFQPGRSGNPRGRPKTVNDPAALFHKVADTKIAIMVNGKQRKVSKLEAVFLRLHQEALIGNMVATKQLLALHKQFPRQHEPQSELTPAEWDELLATCDPDTLEKMREVQLKELAIQDRKRTRKTPHDPA
jgi:hypothetical protein